MPTLWEILTKKHPVQKPLELTIVNPLGLRIGNSLQINTVDYENLTFSFVSLRETQRDIGDMSVFFVDYDLLARPYDGDPVGCRLRLIPEQGDNKECDVILLHKISECGYDKGFHDGLKGQQEFVEGEVTYYRVNEMNDEWNATITTLADKNYDGKIDTNEVSKAAMTYWDFWRNTIDEGGNEILEFYFVEMDANGYFEFWVGQKLESSRVVVI